MHCIHQFYESEVFQVPNENAMVLIHGNVLLILRLLVTNSLGCPIDILSLDFSGKSVGLCIYMIYFIRWGEKLSIHRQSNLFCQYDECHRMFSFVFVHMRGNFFHSVWLTFPVKEMSNGVDQIGHRKWLILKGEYIFV